MDNCKLRGVLYIDIRKAFDSIDHGILLENDDISELEHTSWFQSYLANWQQQCQLNGFPSHNFKKVT